MFSSVAHPRAAASLRTLALAALVLSTARATTWYVSDGSGFNLALSSVAPGDTIVLSGTISGTFKTSKAGTAAAPITIEGDGTAVLSGSGSGYGLEILNDYVPLRPG